MTTSLDKAYAAGLFDGEGSITLTRTRRVRLPSPQVSVASNDIEVLEWLRERFGGSVSKKQPRQPTHSVSYDWRLTDRRALAFLKEIRPYLVIQRKIRRVDLLLKSYVRLTPRNGRYTEEQLRLRQEFVDHFFASK